MNSLIKTSKQLLTRMCYMSNQYVHLIFNNHYHHVIIIIIIHYELGLDRSVSTYLFIIILLTVSKFLIISQFTQSF